MESEGNVKRLYKSRTERMIDGVCGGIAEYIGIDPVLVRIAFLLLIFAGGIGVIAYIIGMILMPAGSAPAATAPAAAAPASAADATTTPAADAGATAAGTGTATPTGGASTTARASESTTRLIGIGFVVLGGVLLLGNLGLNFWPYGWDISWGSIAPLLIIVAGVVLITRSQKAPTPGTGSGNSSGTPSGSTGFTGGAAVFDSRAAHLYRSRTDRKLLGICGGLGVYLGVDPTILRVLLVISALASFGGTILLYLITAIIVPAEPLVARTA